MTKRITRIPVSERNLRAAAKRLLSNGQIVWNEIFYIQRNLPARATQSEIDESVVAVRQLEWADLALAD